METKKDSNVSEVGRQVCASNVAKFIHKEGEGTMNTEQQINEEQERNLVAKGFAQSPLRKARYEFMKELLQRGGHYYVSKESLKDLSSWTREHTEQALEDVIRCGDGKVGRFWDDGSFTVVLRKKEEISESETTRKLHQSDNRQEGGL